MSRRLVALLATALAGAAVSAAPAVASPGVLGTTPAVGQGVLRFPQAIAFSPGGAYVFVADQFSGVVQEFTPAGAWVRDIGTPAGDTAGPGQLGVVGGLATDRAGHLFVLDSEHDRVEVFRSATGERIAGWGSPGAAPGGFALGDNTGAGGLAVEQPDPNAPPVAYVADQGNGRIARYTLAATTSGGDAVLPAGTRTGDDVPVPAPDRTWGSTANCGTPPAVCTSPADDLHLDHPQGVAVVPGPSGADSDTVYVADDDNHRVVVYRGDGTYVAQVGTFGTGAGQFAFPYDVGVDGAAPPSLYVADNNNHRVQAFDPSTLAFRAAWGGFGGAPGQLEYPRALTALADDPAGGVFVTDTANNRVEGFSPAGALVAAWGVSGRDPGRFYEPAGVAVGDAGEVYVAEPATHRVQVLNPDGTVRAVWGRRAPLTPNTAPGSGPGEFNGPSGVAFDPLTGDVWITDTGNDRVERMGSDGTVREIDPGFTGPTGIAAGADGAIYVADTPSGRVLRRDPASGAWAPVAVGATLDAPRAVAVEADGALLVADRSRLLEVRGGVAHERRPPGGLTRPDGLAVDGTRVYVADRGGDRVLRLDLATGGWTTLATQGTAAGAVLSPAGLAVSPDGARVYVADTRNNRVEWLDGTAHAAPPRATVTLVVSGPGTVTSMPPGLSCPTTCTVQEPLGRLMTLTATPAPGSAFGGWAGACGGAASCSFLVHGPVDVTAGFDGPPPPPPDRVPPVLGRLATPSRILRGRRPLLRLTVTLSETARVRFTPQRAAPGRRDGVRCVPPTRRLRRRAACTRWVTAAGAGARSLPAGTSHVRLRLGPLRPGTHRIIAVPTDPAGNVGAPRRLTVHVR